MSCFSLLPLHFFFFFLYRFGGTGKKSNNKQFDTYGEPFGLNDKIGCYIDLDNFTIGFSKNGNCKMCKKGGGGEKRGETKKRGRKEVGQEEMLTGGGRGGREQKCTGSNKKRGY